VRRTPAVRAVSKGLRPLSTAADSAGFFLEDLAVGQTASYAKTVTEADIVLFAGVSGDTNPVHLDQEFAAQTMFKGRIAHGMLSAGFISTVLGTKLPGPGAIYLSQSLKFKAPVRPGDTVRARATITAIAPEKRRVTLATTCHVGDTVVIEGEAVVMVPSRAG
jgi:3-hydroxybutyryl-CoA dehydratase